VTSETIRGSDSPQLYVEFRSRIAAQGAASTIRNFTRSASPEISGHIAEMAVSGTLADSVRQKTLTDDAFVENGSRSSLAIGCGRLETMSPAWDWVG